MLEYDDEDYNDEVDDCEFTKEDQDRLRRAVLGIPLDKRLSPEEQRRMDSYFRAVALLIKEADQRRAAWYAKGCPEGEDPKVTSESGIKALNAKVRAMTEGFYLTGKAVSLG